MHHFGEARKGPRGFVQPILTGHHGASQYGRSEMRNKTEEQDFRRVHPGHWFTERKLNLKDVDHAILRHLNSTYVIEKPFSFTLIINDTMKRFLKKVLKSKKPSLRTIHELGPATSTSTTTGPTDLMLSIPACDSESDGTTSAQLGVAAGVSVSVRLRPSHF